MLLENQGDKNIHENVCLKRFLSLSVCFGQPFSTEIYESLYSKAQREEREMEHAFRQISKLANVLMTEIGSFGQQQDNVKTPDGIDPDTDGLERVNPFQRVLNEEVGHEMIEASST